MDGVAGEALRLRHLLVLALAIRLALFFGGIRGSDAYAYAQHAINIATGQYDVTVDTEYYGFRFAVLLSTALAYKLFGVHDWSSALFPLLASLGTLALIVRLGSAWFDPRTGMLAGLLYTVYPLDLPSATLLGPSSFLPLLSAGAVLSYLNATQGRASPAWYVASGFCVGIAIQAREVGLLLLLPLVLFATTRSFRGSALPIFLMGLGCAAPLAVEAGYYWRKTGDMFFRVTVVEKLSIPFAGGPDPEGVVSLAYYPQAMLGLELGGFAWFGFFGYLALAGIGLAWAGKDMNRILPLLLWLVPVAAYLQFGSMSLAQYIPVLKAYNYFSVVSVPLVLLGAYGLMAAWNLAPRCGITGARLRAAAAILLASIAGTSLYGSYRVLENIRDDARPYQLVAQVVQTHPEMAIYVPHERWALFLNYYLRYRTGFRFYQRPLDRGGGRLHYLWEITDPRDLQRAYVVLHDRYLYYDTVGRPIGRAARLPSYAFSPPAWWLVVMREQTQPAYNSFVLYEADGEETA
jgi:4-amino-4-deoxy-L-arabinose transferase-like glycosyltransferase